MNFGEFATFGLCLTQFLQLRLLGYGVQRPTVSGTATVRRGTLQRLLQLVIVGLLATRLNLPQLVKLVEVVDLLLLASIAVLWVVAVVPELVGSNVNAITSSMA